MSEIKKSIIIFNYVEKIKTNLIITSSLLTVLESLKDEEIAGAEKLLIAYLNALIQEVNIVANASGIQGFLDVRVKLEETVEQTKRHNYVNALKLVSEAVSLTTTSGNQAAEKLKENNLI